MTSAWQSSGWESKMILRSLALVAAIVLLTAGMPLAQAQTLTTIHSFTGGYDGGSPQASLLRDPSGNLYGTTFSGGSPCGYQFGCGTVFKVDTTGKFSVLHTFTGGDDGAQPYAGLIQDAAGNLYGTTFEGGVFGAGTMFELNTSGQETARWGFTGDLLGGYPLGGVVSDPESNLYGTTFLGGGYGYGTVFELSPQSGGGWSETVLYNFQHSSDGAYPRTGLVRDTAGNLYGTTSLGGDGGPGYGVIFKVDTTGKMSVLHAFAGEPDGADPEANLILDSTGNLYGTTFAGGAGNCRSDLHGFLGCGVIFRIDTTGRETILYTFTGGTDGANPSATLIRNNEGDLYGTTVYGGVAGCGDYSAGCGVIFKLDSGGNETVLYTFPGSGAGANPYGGLIGDGAGNAYGTTSTGGNGVGPGTGCDNYFCGGTVFKLTP